MVLTVYRRRLGGDQWDWQKWRTFKSRAEANAALLDYCRLRTTRSSEFCTLPYDSVDYPGVYDLTRGDREVIDEWEEEVAVPYHRCGE